MKQAVALALSCIAFVGCSEAKPVKSSTSPHVVSTASSERRAAPTSDDPQRSRSAGASDRCDASEPNSDGTPKRAPQVSRSHPPETLVLSYDDFGPQASAGKILGSQWWTWEPGGSFERCDDFDIRVVVYRGVPLEKVRSRYPSARSASDLRESGWADHRFVQYAVALEHLDTELADIADTPELAGMVQVLRRTRARITETLGD